MYIQGIYVRIFLIIINLFSQKRYRSIGTAPALYYSIFLKNSFNRHKYCTVPSLFIFLCTYIRIISCRNMKVWKCDTLVKLSKPVKCLKCNKNLWKPLPPKYGTATERYDTVPLSYRTFFTKFRYRLILCGILANLLSNFFRFFYYRTKFLYTFSQKFTKYSIILIFANFCIYKIFKI